jgi:hypothetical protein
LHEVHVRILRTLVLFVIVTALLARAPAAAQTTQTEQERRRLEALKTLPYLQWTEKKTDEKERGVTIYDRALASPGYTLYSGPARAVLVDMDGNVAHEWTNASLKEWEYAEMLPNGDLIVLLSRRSISRLDWSGKLLWERKLPVHHDFCFLPGGDVAALVHETVLVPEISDRPIETDAIARISPAGEITTFWHLVEHRRELARWCTPKALTSVSDNVEENDWSHANTIEVITETPASASIKAFRPGNILFCARNLDFVGIIDAASGEIVWGWGPGELDHPHQPSLLPNGHILVFDNGFFRGWSRVVEYDPAKAAVVWEYRTERPEDFFSMGRGSCQKLPNGNVLITDSAHGRVFEVTPDRKTVWTFFNPDRSHEKRGTFYRSTRYPVTLVQALLRMHPAINE